MNNPNLAIALAFYRSVFNDFIVHDPSQRSCYRSSMRNVVRRIQTEGLTFVSKSLPDLGKACETSIISGDTLIVPRTFGLHWKSKLPNLMWEQFHILFDDFGTPRQVETEDAVWAYFVIRQVTLAFSKAKDIPSRMTPEEATKGFCERIVEEPAITAPSWLLNEARALIRRIVMEGDELHPILKQWVLEPVGKHGPGAVSEQIPRRNKYLFPSWSARLE